jgi:Zn-dependent M32 family carboxypeptidase
MLGELLASQLHNYIVENFGEDFDSDYSGNRDVSKYLIEKIFKAGNKYTSSELVERATGEKLTVKCVLDEFCA